jgi:hypothetical protein
VARGARRGWPDAAYRFPSLEQVRLTDNINQD